jgi:hypothetical protein
MARQRDLVYTEFYAPYLSGGNRVANNPANNQQAMLERMYTRMLSELCMNRFEWSELPDEIDPRFLELNLTYRGLVVFYLDNDIGKYVTAQGSGAGHTNFMDHPVSFTVIGPGIGAGHPKNLKAVGDTPQCVPIWANYLRCPDLDIISIYSHKLAKLDRTIEITMDNMRKTKVIAAPENERLSYVNILRQIAEGQEAIFGTNAMDISTVQVLDLGVDPLTLPNLMIAKSKLWNECMGLLGINNANQDKKERLVAAEVGANDEQVQATRNIALNARQQACEEINRLYGLNISVDFKNPPPPAMDDMGGEEFVSGGTSSDNQGAGATA